MWERCKSINLVYAKIKKGGGTCICYLFKDV